LRKLALEFPPMRILLAIAAFAVSALLFSLFMAATVDAVTSWGLQEAFITMFCFWQNAIIFSGMFLLGSTCLYSGIVLLKRRPIANAVS
jgi:hypothetical protein